MKTKLLFMCFLALCNLTLLGQTAVHTPEKSEIHVPPQEAPVALKSIYSNLGKGTNVYNTVDAWALQGPNSNSTEFLGMPFTPKSNSHVSEVRVAVQYFGPGANQVNLSIYGDTGGTPGTLLAGPVTVTNLPAAGTCCTLAVADFTPLAVTAGTKYWVVGDTPLTDTGSDFSGQWNWIANGRVEWAQNFGGFGWFLIPSDALPAGQVLGTVP